MSLTPAQRQQNAQELQANRALCPLSDAQLCAALGYTPQQLADTLQVSQASNPAEVWRLRDFLEQVLRDLGTVPVPFTIMHEGKRQDARGWFGRWSVPPTPKNVSSG